ncbi:VanZ family protein [Microcella sp.]|uniref:VanZ family protein n=1 Tax=Microcella sp. TaxID=1913979 RepID=UPI00299F5950|nr:VanZ family protein [Microcella sp.]MDX2026897.1 VanZ family protein [Microcella sp.]
MDRITPGIIAIIIGAIIAILLFVPFVAASYRLRGGMTVGRTIGWAALLVSFLAIWTYTILPAPAITDDYRCSTPNLDLLTDIRDILLIQQSGTSLIANASLQVVVLNIIFFMPLGFLVRYLFGWGVARAALSGLVVSLAVETTQLTGIWGLYPCSYRLFSVTDLTHNTLGAVIGSLIALALLRRRQALAPSVAEPRPVTVGRRLLGMLSDVLVFSLVSLIAGLLVSLLRILVIAPGSPTVTDPLETAMGLVIGLVVYLVPVLVTGTTIGESAVLLRATGGWRPTVLARLVRAMLGLGGVIVLSEVIPVVGDVLSLALVVAIIATLVVDRERQGLAARASGQRVIDARESVDR